MRFSLDHLEAFVVAVDTGSFSAAARKLGKVQSQVSTAIASLEDDLGVKLFDRSGKYPTLTAHGEDLLFQSRELLRYSERLASHADRLVFGEQTLLRVALDELMPVEITTQVLGKFRQAWPNIELEVILGAVGDVHKSVSAGESDVGVDIPVYNIFMSGLSFKQLAHIAFCGVVAAEHPLATMRDVSEETLRPYLQAMGTRLPDVFRLGDRVWLCEDSRLIHSLVLAGEVWAALPRHLVAEDLASGKLVELALTFGEFGAENTFYYIWNPVHELTLAEFWLGETFGESIRKICRG
ncbi:transcriptional regulator, LysR family [Maridesulfovibrio ferrireducens]|uniref:Transcriptional regulator, LysR family n=1 Tax=Maridesulfovibrio ferrireducens TaxID=246191 RepID=A0A1G9IYX9_9BACT|nr:LysR family transcriptional regulator [Maridesulfovibrio ferrireducens]SDL30295.1 transcriptional regulator, LysR family [Maridesulfovibrio ferrireducens]